MERNICFLRTLLLTFHFPLLAGPVAGWLQLLFDLTRKMKCFFCNRILWKKYLFIIASRFTNEPSADRRFGRRHMRITARPVNGSATGKG